jgi:hypothetical protein
VSGSGGGSSLDSPIVIVARWMLFAGLALLNSENLSHRIRVVRKIQAVPDTDLNHPPRHPHQHPIVAEDHRERDRVNPDHGYARRSDSHRWRRSGRTLAPTRDRPPSSHPAACPLRRPMRSSRRSHTTRGHVTVLTGDADRCKIGHLPRR